MSGFFSLTNTNINTNTNKSSSSTTSNQQQQQETLPNSSFLLFRNQEIYSSNRGFELWHHHQQYYHRNTSNSNPEPSNYRSPPAAAPAVGAVAPALTMNTSTVNCQDCGNQAKKDCSHLRCRTCCKSRGFQCQTHLKSTWVPAAKRRERQQQQLNGILDHQNQTTQQQQQLSLMRTTSEDHRQIYTKRPRDQNNNTGLEVGHFPAEVNSSSVFRCVKVSNMDDTDHDQVAYQTAVNIGGHIFKGILYDQGPDITATAGTGSSAGTHNQGLGMIDTSINYPAPLNAFMAGTQFFPPPRP